jgi:hypothetical protein
LIATVGVNRPVIQREHMYDWEGLWALYEPVRFGEPRRGRFEMPGAARHAFSHPKPPDAAWLVASLRDERRKWLVADVAGRARVPEALLEPMLDAAIEETNPSFNRSFVEPCMTAFGPRRANEYLLDALASGDDFRKTGAANALYWAGVPLEFRARPPSYDPEHATPESRERYEALADVWARKRLLLLQTFVESASVDVQRSVIGKLNLDPAAYPAAHRDLVDRATDIGLNHRDEYVRHRTSVQLGRENVFQALPPRGPRSDGGSAE